MAVAMAVWAYGLGLEGPGLALTILRLTGPTLFLLFINDIDEIFLWYKCMYEIIC